MSKERPILMNGAMVRAVLDGRKTQTRRIVKPQHLKFFNQSAADMMGDWSNRPFPYGQPGDRLWVRENFCPVYAQDPTYNNGEPIEIDYAATYKHGDRLVTPKWKPSIHMPRWASRILLEITGVRVERLQDISDEGALAEGINKIAHGREGYFYHYQRTEAHQNNKCFADDAFQELWESINGPGSWDVNPWVWVIEFKVLP